MEIRPIRETPQDDPLGRANVADILQNDIPQNERPSTQISSVQISDLLPDSLHESSGLDHSGALVTSGVVADVVGVL